MGKFDLSYLLLLLVRACNDRLFTWTRKPHSSDRSADVRIPGLAIILD